MLGRTALLAQVRRARARRRPGRLRHGPVRRRGQRRGGPVRRDDVRARPGGRERWLRRLRLHVAQPGAALALLPAPRGSAPLHPRTAGATCATRPRTSTSGGTGSTYLDPAGELVNPFVHYLAEGRHRGHAPLPPVLPVKEVPPALGRRPRRVCLFAGFDARRDHRRLRGRVRPGAEPVRRRLLPGRLPAGGRRARQAGALHARPVDHPPRPLRLRLLLDAGPRPGRLGHPGDVRRGAAGQRQLPTWCGRWTRCSRPWTPARRTGGACRPPTTTSLPGDLERLGRRLRVDDLVARSRAGSDRGGCPTASTSARTSWRCGPT